MEETTRSFEDLYRELEETVRRLESGDLALADMLALFERGAALAEQCHALLDRAELRVRKLAPGDDGGLDAETMGVFPDDFEDWQTGA